MANQAFNYSKWDNIELSDDESDLHPNIDKESWFRLKHRTRLEREEKEDQEVLELTKKNDEDNSRLKFINARIQGVNSDEKDDDCEFEDVEALEIEKLELQEQIKVRNQRIEQINERRKWNIDNICKVKEEKTVLNKNVSTSLTAEIKESDYEKIETITKTKTEKSPTTVTAGPPTDTVFKSVNNEMKSNSDSKSVSVPTVQAPPEVKKREKLAVISYNDYCIKHEDLLERYSEIDDMEATEDFLFKHCDVLLHEHAQSYMLLSCLEDEMNGKKKRMKLVCRQSQILTHIHELGISMRRDPRDVIKPFFKRISEVEYYKGFLSAVDDFIARIQKRAIEKRKEMQQQELEEQGGNPPIGPGGLDPFEVLNSLPTALREAFESQDLQRLQDVLANMEPAEAKDCMKRCVDSGLWVPQDASIFEDEGNVEEDVLVEEGKN